MHTTYDSVPPYVTKDGSEIRELMHPSVHGNRNQSLAEATVLPGARTALHRHQLTEEIYHITGGAGMMTLGGKRFAVDAPPGIAGAGRRQSDAWRPPRPPEYLRQTQPRRRAVVGGDTHA